MLRADIHNRTIGVNFNEQGTAEVLLWAPLAQQVEISLITDKVKLPLQKKVYGYWHTVTDLLKEGAAYKFVLNGKSEYPDPASLAQPAGVHGASEAISLKQFPWTDADWNTISLQDYILYELHTGTFTQEGTFKAMEEKLEYLIDLGINGNEIGRAYSLADFQLSTS